MADRQRFEAEALVHLDAAYNLARWLLREPADADDVVQEALLRAWRAWDGRRGAQVKPWLLAIVRNCALTALGARGRAAERAGGDPGHLLADVAAPAEQGPAALTERAQVLLSMDAALGRLAPDYREVIVLREIEDLSYREIAAVVGVPVGTVMSRLARARAALRVAWGGPAGGGDGLP